MTEPDHKPSMVPIAAAFGIVAVLLLAVFVSRMIIGDEIPDRDQVGRAVVGQNDALQRENYADFRRYTCLAQQGTEQQVIGDQRQSKAVKGNRVVDDVKDVVVTGDRATATAVYHFEKKADGSDGSQVKLSTPMTFARENGEWTVCSPGPR